MELHFRLILLIFLFLFSAFFSASETSLFSLKKLHFIRLKKRHEGLYAIINNLLSHPQKLIITILIGNEIVNNSISILIASYYDRHFPGISWERLALISTITTTPLVLILGEIVPKFFAINAPRTFAQLVGYPLNLFFKIIAPLRFIIWQLANIFITTLGGRGERDEDLTEKEFLSLIDDSSKEGVIEEEEKRMIHRVFEMEGKTAQSIMTPQERVYAIPLNKSYQELMAEIKTIQFSRLPVYREKKEEIVGILHCKSLLEAWLTKKELNLENFLQKPFIIPKTMKLDILLAEFQKRKSHLAIVVNEYGKMIGIVSLEDVLEQLVGTIEDERD